jgi:hypothetical protein
MLHASEGNRPSGTAGGIGRLPRKVGKMVIIESISTIVASAAAIVASIVAVWGINAWRREHVGRRRIDLAEEVLGLFYGAREVISSFRSPVG